MVFPGDTGASFSVLHVTVTAAITAGCGVLISRWRLAPLKAVDTALIALVVGASVFLWRLSANMPQLNDDDLPGFSANDWLCPVITYVFLSTYAAFRPQGDPVRWGQARALLTIASLVINVVTI